MLVMNFDPSWQRVLNKELSDPRVQKLSQFLFGEMRAGKRIFPDPENYFEALNQTPFNEVKVVLLGQDPYHSPGQAHGLSFSVKKGVPLPPSLKNIFKELKADLMLKMEGPPSGDLTGWARQGVLLLNSVLTVEAGAPASHQNQGWEILTDRIIQSLSQERENLVFILWGAQAQRKVFLIDRARHFVLESAHPSPLSAHRGFFGSRPFSRTNAYLQQVGKSAIHWTRSYDIPSDGKD